MDEDFASKVSADHYIFCGNGEHENPDLRVIDILFNSRSDDDDKFHFWFSTTSALQNEGTKKREYFAELEEHVDELKGDSGGRLKLHFNQHAFIELNLDD